MRRINIFLITISFLTITSCSKKLVIAEYLYPNLPLTLTINKTNEKTGLTEFETRNINPNSEKFQVLINWGNNNTDNWEPSPVSYLHYTVVSQNNFAINCSPTYVVANFTDKDGKGQQYAKKIKKGELDFLNDIGWTTYKDTVNVGFIMTFKYPDNLLFSDIIESCRSVGKMSMSRPKIGLHKKV